MVLSTVCFPLLLLVLTAEGCLSSSSISLFDGDMMIDNIENNKCKLLKTLRPIIHSKTVPMNPLVAALKREGIKTGCDIKKTEHEPTETINKTGSSIVFQTNNIDGIANISPSGIRKFEFKETFFCHNELARKRIAPYDNKTTKKDTRTC